MRRCTIIAILVLNIGCDASPNKKSNTPVADQPNIGSSDKPTSSNPIDAKPANGLIVMDQGADWTPEARAWFYTQDQGSRLIPLSWLKGLKRPDGTAFLADRLSRYGYLSNIEDVESELPAGFTKALMNGTEYAGMTCAACHTRQIEVGDKSYRIDGGPAFADFQSFCADLDTAVSTVVKDPKAFTEFAHAVLPQPSTAEQESKLKTELDVWYLPYHELMSRALPADDPWGPTRLDAVGMIFNRLTGLDIGEGPDHLILENIRRADAPARYPFIWNAWRQDKTQWPGFSPNGDDILGLSRNLGEVYGVFAAFHPKHDPNKPHFLIDFISDNSANFDGLSKLEDGIKKIEPPKYPWPVDQDLVKQGEEIFNRKSTTDDYSCSECHGIKNGKPRLGNLNTWATPILDVGTDHREVNLLSRTAKPGVLARTPKISNPDPTALNVSFFGDANEKATDLLGAAVFGAILQHKLFDLADIDVEKPDFGDFKTLTRIFKSPQEGLSLSSFDNPPADIPAASKYKTGQFKYESRVLQGIWAAAPYLHNGSVPTLEDLLNPVEERPESFKIGPEYDPVRVGLAKDQKKFNFTLHTTDAANLDSGKSRAGHEFGTRLNAQEKKALLEYLKTL